MVHRLDQFTCAIPRGGYRARFSPSAFFISSNIQSRQKRSCYLGNGRALFTHKEHRDHYFSSRESCWHHLPLTSQQSQNVHLDEAFMEPLKIFYSQDTEIELRSNLGRASCHLLPNWRTIRQHIKASCNRRDSG